MKINKNISYMIGFLQADGNLQENTRNRGKLTLEINSRDEHILYEFQKIIPYYSNITCRNRDTTINNYEYNTDFSCLSVYALDFRTFLNENGIPYGKKSFSVKPPLHITELSIVDYIRGLYDGDGSVGFTEKNYPFTSLATDSDYIANFIMSYIANITGNPKKETKRNNRDNIYNIVITKEDAVIFCNTVYYNNCLSLNRKYEKSNLVKQWIRPSNMKKRPIHKKWTSEDDGFILYHDIDESIEKLDRTKSSIQTRLWRLQKRDVSN